MTEGFAYLIAAYLAGSLCMGWFLVRALAGGDLRRLGSGTVGARNTGRILGPAGFLATLAGDFGKGALVVAAGLYLELAPAFVAGGLAAVIAGHIWPAWLGFHGGKGIATLLGVLAVLDVRLLALMLCTWGLSWAVLRHLSLAGLVAIAALPLLALLPAHLPEVLPFQQAPAAPHLVGLGAVVVVVLVAHASNIKDYLGQRWPSVGASS